ncbi:unnamed protein product, partial [Ectocarpus sp. 4 AP-2014]
ADGGRGARWRWARGAWQRTGWPGPHRWCSWRANGGGRDGGRGAPVQGGAGRPRGAAVPLVQPPPPWLPFPPEDGNGSRDQSLMFRLG